LEATGQNHSHPGAPEANTFTIPFGSKGNSIELDIDNASRTDSLEAVVMLLDPPAWMHINSSVFSPKPIPPGGSGSVLFTYSLDKKAPEKKAEDLMLIIKSRSGEVWNTTIGITIGTPSRYHLYQNYPNPFNPLTRIAYQLPENAQVSVKVYNILGQAVSTVFDGSRPPGYYEDVWNGSNAASGTYFYQARFLDAKGNTQVFRNKMLLVK
jgi:hypothetical protein